MKAADPLDRAIQVAVALLAAMLLWFFLQPAAAPSGPTGWHGPADVGHGPRPHGEREERTWRGG